ncbi:MAG TPA: nicotinate (nicotinamide) nucleotide adenylyltransferase [Treponema sp.]|nr:nicotinate (nicotinamide) nucleotide adenylyltransferase [Treponema sp.]
MKLAMLGGLFNPVHNGHLALAAAVRDQGGFDQVLLIPAYISPGKQVDYTASVQDRLAMLSLATANTPSIGVDDCEVSREGISWSIDTLRDLTLRYSSHLSSPVAMVIGQDHAATFLSWKEAENIARDFIIIIAQRPPYEPVAFPYPHITVNNPPVEVSSSEIRRAIREGGSWEFFVPKSVEQYILEHGLYAS